MTTVLISGANRGIGLELARQYAADGARVIAGVRDPGAALALKAISGVEVHTLDVADEASVQAFHQAVGELPVDILIANAGVGGGRSVLGELDFDRWLQTLNVNSLGPVRLAQAFLPNVKASADKKMVAISSTLGSTSTHAGDMFAYRASKAALNNAWVGLAAALKGEGLTFLLLHPGWVKTDMGGAGAQITPAASAEGLRERIAEAGPALSGRLFAYDGEPLPW
ncbi:SDR family oxidoreductase [Caulobacter sp. S45]|uniref:SDR family oxidoreductase n=1 Tax=Caulobacter sp. S45 TaxID=1641861 RepID=UPI0015760C0A|nr:SDR family oxidoreductase [Caulobacter sp. S45]